MKREKIINIEKETKENHHHKRNKILVNMITGIRSLGTIAVIPIFLNCGSFITALAASGFLVTDCIDGFLARKLKVQSFFGSLLDALSDKTFGIICLLLLSTLNPIFLAVMGIELGIFAINYTSAQKDHNVKTSKVGRAKTLLLAGTIVGSFFCYGAPTLKELLNYINVSTFNTLLETNPDILTTILAIPTIGANLYVAKDYLNIAKNQEKEEQAVIEQVITQSAEPSFQDVTMNLEEIAQKREELLNQKEQLKVLKSREEIMHDLFDTEFYLEHKDDKLKSLLYKQR